MESIGLNILQFVWGFFFFFCMGFPLTEEKVKKCGPNNKASTLMRGDPKCQHGNPVKERLPGGGAGGGGTHRHVRGSRWLRVSAELVGGRAHVSHRRAEQLQEPRAGFASCGEAHQCKEGLNLHPRQHGQ